MALVPSALKGETFVKLRGALAAVAALSLAAAPTVASAAPAAARTTAVTPASESVSGENALRGNGGGVFIGVIAFVLIITGIVIAVKKKDRPNSP